MGLVENIEVFDELLRNGVPTKKFVNYKNWDEVLKLLAKSSTDRYAQLPSGQVVKILDKVAWERPNSYVLYAMLKKEFNYLEQFPSLQI